VNLRPTLTYVVNIQSGITNRLISKSQHESVKNIIVALSYGTSLFSISKGIHVSKVGDDPVVRLTGAR